MKRNIYDKNVLYKFYKIVGQCDFSEITLDRKQEIDLLVEKHKYYFINSTCGLLALMTYVAEKLIVSSKSIGLLTISECAYFYVKIVDPEFLFLETKESANTIEELKNYCLTNFRIYDPIIIRLETNCNKYFNIYESEELWTRDRIKKSDKRGNQR